MIAPVTVFNNAAQHGINSSTVHTMPSESSNLDPNWASINSSSSFVIPILFFLFVFLLIIVLNKID